jgi:ubiquinone biosynthesis protein UbiJ
MSKVADYIEDSVTGEKRREKQNEKDIRALKSEIETLKKRIDTLEKKK